jgi:3-phenylpropionate/trans-cinnamate dioxygenase ferredoxin reductase component
MESDRVVIVGAGHAASEFAGALRQARYPGPVLMLGEEFHLPYHRPPLSKAFLSGESSLQALELKPTDSYAKIGVDVRTGVRVETLDRRHRSVTLSDGSREPYGKLVLATGGRPRRLALPSLGRDRTLSNVHYLRTIEDAGRLRRQLKPGSQLVVVGAGYIGLEVAAVARKLGLHVTVLETQPRVLARVTAPEISTFYSSVHHGAGVDIRTNTTITAVELDTSGDAVKALQSADGSVFPVDLLIVGVGLVPNVELAQAAGLAVENGIVVNEFGQTSDPDILAIGDCCNYPSELYGRRVRVESVPNASAHARVAAAWVCGRRETHTAAPWFWSDQYDLKLQIVGLSQDYDRLVVRGKPEDRSFMAFYLQGRRILAVDAVNRPAEFMVVKRLVAQKACVSSPEQLSDESWPLQNLNRAAVTSHTG